MLILKASKPNPFANKNHGLPSTQTLLMAKEPMKAGRWGQAYLLIVDKACDADEQAIEKLA